MAVSAMAVHAMAVPAAVQVLNDDTVSPGWLGLVVFLALGAATVFLLRSFRKQLAKVPPSFEQTDPSVPVDPGPGPTQP